MTLRVILNGETDYSGEANVIKKGIDHGVDDLKDVELLEDEDKVTLHLQPAPSLTQCLLKSLRGLSMSPLNDSKGDMKWTDCGITSLQEAYLRTHRYFVHEGKTSDCEGCDSISARISIPCTTPASSKV